MLRTQVLHLAMLSSSKRIHSALFPRSMTVGSLSLICIPAICHCLVDVDVPNGAEHAKLKRKVVQLKRACSTLHDQVAPTAILGTYPQRIEISMRGVLYDTRMNLEPPSSGSRRGNVLWSSVILHGTCPIGFG